MMQRSTVLSEEQYEFDDQVACNKSPVLERYITASIFTYSILGHSLTASEIKYLHRLCRRDETLDEVAQRIVQKQFREASFEG